MKDAPGEMLIEELCRKCDPFILGTEPNPPLVICSYKMDIVPHIENSRVVFYDEDDPCDPLFQPFAVFPADTVDTVRRMWWAWLKGLEHGHKNGHIESIIASLPSE